MAQIFSVAIKDGVRFCQACAFFVRNTCKYIKPFLQSIHFDLRVSALVFYPATACRLLDNCMYVQLSGGFIQLFEVAGKQLYLLGYPEIDMVCIIVMIEYLLPD